MKNLFITAVVSSLVFISCRKEDCPIPETPSIVGFWQGKYGGTTSYPNSGYSALFRSNGTVRFFDGADTATANEAEGTYSVIGSTVTASYNYLFSGFQYSVSATVDSKFTFLEGTFGTGVNTSGDGKWFMIKK
ncbi:MAG: hypothetical protein HYZ15_07495 [Sphingobacteriales bacterium]|nr:hypothetical protein [Sphingobacteriales bacterium]